MKNRLFYLLFTLTLIISVSHSYAQVGASRNVFAVGVNGGATISTLFFSPSIKQTSYIGNTYGVTFSYTSEKYFWMICASQLEINFAQRGWKELIEDGSGNQYSRTLNYIEIPFMAHLGFGREHRGFQGFLNLGPQLGYFISDREIYGGTKPWDTNNRANNVIDQYGKSVENSFEYGISAGVGAECKTGVGGFLLELRYFLGLSDIWHNSKKDPFARSSNSTISVKFAYMIEL
ncbi:MAG TPA: porin family protein [Bacteroidaceae bacterium]|nr:porin family protein [Bacteroidaceae bacterium]